MACARVDIRSLLIPFTRRDIALMCVICNHSFRQQLLFVSFMCVIGFFSLSVRLLNTLRRFAFVSDVCFCVDSLWPEITFLGWLSLDLCTFVVVAVVRWFFFSSRCTSTSYAHISWLLAFCLKFLLLALCRCSVS